MPGNTLASRTMNFTLAHYREPVPFNTSQLSIWNQILSGTPTEAKPQEIITQYICNKPASWPLNVRLSAAKTRFTQSKFRMLHALCSASNLRAREKRRKTSVQADSQGHVSHCYELRDGPLEKWWGGGGGTKKIHAKKKVKKKIHAEGRSNCDFFRKSEFQKSTILPGTIWINKNHFLLMKGDN